MSTNPAATPRRPIHHSLMAMTAAPLAHAHHRRYAGKPHHLVLDTILNLCLWGLVAWVIVVGVTKVVSDVPRLSWSTTELMNGQGASVTAAIQSSPIVRFENVQLTVDWPEGWTAMSHNVTVGAIGAGQTATTTFRIVPITVPDIIVPVVSHLRWTSAHRTYETMLVTRMTVKGPMAEMAISGPAEVQNNGQATITVTVTAPGRDTVPQEYVTLDLPAGVTLESTSPEQFEGSWSVNGITESLTNPKSLAYQATVRIIGRPGSTVRIGARLTGQSLETRPLQMARSVDILIAATSGAEVVEQNSGTYPSIAAEVRYHSSSGIQFGYGPLPPTVGQETVYRVFWYVRPGTLAANGGVVRMKLPTGVRWVGHTSLGGGVDLSFNRDTNTVMWTIGRLESSGMPMVASFDIGLTPKTSDRGKAMTIASTSQLSFQLPIGGNQAISTGRLLTTDVDSGSGKLGKIK